MLKNPGKTTTIYQMGSLIGAAWLKACTPNNIISGFIVTGIWPFNRDIFHDDEFLQSAITDRPQLNCTAYIISLETGNNRITNTGEKRLMTR